ncbi:MAG TPA: hypothetical protein PKD53_12445, partial [Chloroflexaceae bacterium]|nr:hypothetical protein [Chloroflexaceae bacterium]
MSLAAAHAAFLAAHPPRRLLIGGVAWELIEAGAGPAVLLLHGGHCVPADARLYEGALDRR